MGARDNWRFGVPEGASASVWGWLGTVPDGREDDIRNGGGEESYGYVSAGVIQPLDRAVCFVMHPRRLAKLR